MADYLEGKKFGMLTVKRTHLGTFSTEVEAALAYNKASLDAFGENAYLNKIPTP
jgi:hypothetical protein